MMRRLCGGTRLTAWATAALWLALGVSTPARAANDSTTTGPLTALFKPFLSQYDLSMGVMGCVFRDGQTGRILYARNADVPLKPASNNKILTTAAALHYLGPGYQYETVLAVRGIQRGDTLEGDLVVVGSGDPSISGRFVPNHDRKAILRQWADFLVQRGIRRITGNVVGIDDAFDDQAQAPGWPETERGEWYCAEVSALAFNDSCVDVRWSGAGAGDREPARFEIIPLTQYVQIVNFVTAVSEKAPHERYYERPPTRNVFTVRGRIGTGEEVFDSAAVFNPTLYFATVLAETLCEAGIALEGKPRDIDEYKDKSPFEGTLVRLTAYQSPPLSRLVEVVNMNSHNFYAEQILKTLGREIEGEGSFAAGCRVVRRYLETCGIDTRGLHIVDGSGLSRLDRVTPNQIAATLLAVSRTSDSALFFSTLPQGGTSGSLRKRFQSTSALRRIGPNVRAKTGYIRGCHALSGWLETRAGQSICFSILCNDLPMTDDRTKQFIEQMVARVVESRKRW
ncbi:MAG: D-alanyl-D-alanine carboxypeptidase/D-alanyl-D-alanine-endopeptidase [Candidatus Sumerlaeia bacterium]|nr:D-alanyl-D-alanine carboxypeptidase/D-alanyl-D-alanine-endopeptidase [Candidatus Sumerlaeia bacterium]